MITLIKKHTNRVSNEWLFIQKQQTINSWLNDGFVNLMFK